jgi:hypothetical protein
MVLFQPKFFYICTPPSAVPAASICGYSPEGSPRVPNQKLVCLLTATQCVRYAELRKSAGDELAMGLAPGKSEW